MGTLRLSDCNMKENIGNRVDIVFLCKSIVFREYSNKPGEYCIIMMKDKSKEIEAKAWVVTDNIRNIEPGVVYEALIDVKDYNKAKDGYSCIVADITKTGYDPALFLDWDENVSICATMLQDMLDFIDGTIYGKICTSLLQKYWDKFSTSAAGRKNHHTKLGSLLCHSVSVANTAHRLGEEMNTMYSNNLVNLKLCVAGGLLHDIGKIEEIGTDIGTGSVEYTTEATLQTHIMSGMILVEREASLLGIDHTNEELRLLIHLIGTHHGLLEWGSPMEPNTPEAFLVHIADRVDATMWTTNEVYKELPAGESTTLWIGGKAMNIYRENSKV